MYIWCPVQTLYRGVPDKLGGKSLAVNEGNVCPGLIPELEPVLRLPGVWHHTQGLIPFSMHFQQIVYPPDQPSESDMGKGDEKEYPPQKDVHFLYINKTRNSGSSR